MRSVLQNYQGDAKIIIVGDKPPWYDGPHLPVKRVRRGKNRAFRDSLNKLMTAVASPLVDDEFVWMMDDIYFNKPVTDRDLKIHYYQSTMTEAKLEKYKPGNKWQRLKLATFKRLHAAGLPMRDYATHLPQHVEKSKFKELVRRFDPGCTSRLMLWEELYGNLYAENARPSGSVLYRTLKRKPYRIYANIDRKFINNGNKAWNEALRGYLWESFPAKSQFETEEAPAPYPWFRTERPTMPADKRVVAIVPYRSSPERAVNKKWVQEYLDARCDEVVFADSVGEVFSRAQAINNAVRSIKDSCDPDKTILIIADADCFITGLRFNQAVKSAFESNRLVIPHDTVCRMDPNQSSEVLADKSPVEGPNGRWFRDTRSKQCVSGILAIKLKSFIQINGFDEAFVGWGGEDNAFFLTCQKLLGESVRLDGPLYHLWHTKSTMECQPANADRYYKYKSATAIDLPELATNGLDLK